MVRIIATVLVVVSAYFYGYYQGQNKEELKNARAQIVQLTETVKAYETRYKNQAIAMAELRVSESAARADSDRMRSRIASLEKRAKTTADRDTVRCLELGAECRRLLQQVRGPVEYCRKALQ